MGSLWYKSHRMAVMDTNFFAKLIESIQSECPRSDMDSLSLISMPQKTRTISNTSVRRAVRMAAVSCCLAQNWMRRIGAVPFLCLSSVGAG